jgi:uncharacterized protein (TIGR02266 family)
VPYAVAVQFRSATSFLVAYSVNLSRGGLFLETQHELPVGTPLELSFEIPGSGAVGLAGHVAWRRGPESPEGPAGLGVEFLDITAALSAVIDRLVGGYQGIQILIVAHDAKDRTSPTTSTSPSSISTAIPKAASPRSVWRAAWPRRCRRSRWPRPSASAITRAPPAPTS